MSLSPMQKSILLSTSVSSVLFGVSTVPLALYSSSPLEVQFRNQPVFDNEMKALAGPYLGLAGTVSVALGVGFLGMSGWRSAATQSETEKSKRSDLEKHLLACKAELERIKFSDARLQTEKLGDFLQPERVPAPQRQSAPARAVSPSSYQVISSPTPNRSHGIAGNHSLAAANPPRHPAATTFQPQGAGMHTAGTVTEPQPTKPQLYTANAQVAQHLGASPITKAATPKPPAQQADMGSEREIQVMLKQLSDLMARVESLQDGGANQVAA